jgi:hypothetical protein
MTQKPLYQSIKAIKTPLIFVLGVFGLLLALQISATAYNPIYESDFEDFNLHECVGGQDGWTADDSYFFIEYLEGNFDKAIFYPTSTATSTRTDRTGDVLTGGAVAFDFKFDCVEIEDANTGVMTFEVYQTHQTAGKFGAIWKPYLVGGVPKCDSSNQYQLYIRKWSSVSSQLYDAGAFSGGDVDNIAFVFEAPNLLDVYLNFNLILSTTTYSTWTTVSNIEFMGYYGVDVPWEFWVDDIEGFNDCAIYSNYYNCEEAGCCWAYASQYWQAFPEYSEYCAPCPTGECGESLYDCPNCLTQETCEEWNFCYWYQPDEICKFGTGVCGEGINLQFCDTGEDCEGAGGYWYDDYCWLSAPPEIFTDWDTYYDLYGDYATASEWITGVASTSFGFFQNIGGFLTTFGDRFDLQEAYQKGKNFGKAIPLARGYLGLLNDFAGDLPIGEFFIFILVFMLAVGVYRLVRSLIQLVKFW